MPALQKGSISKDGKSVRYRDEHGTQQRAGGFRNRTEAAKWLRDKCQEVEARRRGDVIDEPKREDPPTFDVLCDEYLEQHVADPSTIRTLKERLKRPRAKFGDIRIDRLSVSEMRAWFKTLPPGYAPAILRSIRQVLAYSVECGYIDVNPAKSVKVPAPKKREVLSFDTFEDVRKVAAKLPIRFKAIPLFAAATGLRPEEWAALERGDIDRAAGVVHVRRVVVDGVVKDTMKTDGSLRDVPLSTPALEALDSIMPRLDTPLVFPSQQGKHVNLDNWRRRDWTPAVEDAGFEGRTPYSLRHSFISWLLASGLPAFEVARISGTSLRMIDQTYGHLMPTAHDRVRVALDTLDTQAQEADAK
jgi:integrase